MSTLTGLLNNLPSLEKLEQMALQGVPRSLVDELAEILEVRSYDLAPLLHISSRTLRRYNPSRLLPPDTSERALLIARVLKKVIDVLGTRENAVGWLTDMNGALGAVPIDLLDTAFGVERVEHILGRIEDTVYS